MSRPYNSNIDLIRLANGEPLQADEYYVLMVVDYDIKFRTATAFASDRDTRTFFNRSTGQIGLERTSDGQIYISKNRQLRTYELRGETWVVRVKNPALCCVLRG